MTPQILNIIKQSYYLCMGNNLMNISSNSPFIQTRLYVFQCCHYVGKRHQKENNKLIQCIKPAATANTRQYVLNKNEYVYNLNFIHKI